MFAAATWKENWLRQIATIGLAHPSYASTGINDNSLVWELHCVQVVACLAVCYKSLAATCLRLVTRNLYISSNTIQASCMWSPGIHVVSLLHGAFNVKKCNIFKTFLRIFTTCKIDKHPWCSPSSESSNKGIWTALISKLCNISVWFVQNIDPISMFATSGIGKGASGVYDPFKWEMAYGKTWWANPFHGAVLSYPVR